MSQHQRLYSLNNDKLLYKFSKRILAYADVIACCCVKYFSGEVKSVLVCIKECIKLW
jgi:hypothetical protein